MSDKKKRAGAIVSRLTEAGLSTTERSSRTKRKGKQRRRQRFKAT